MKAYKIRTSLKELPNVWREVTVPSGISLQAFHLVIQYAMGWQDIQYYAFRVDGDPTEYTNWWLRIYQFESQSQGLAEPVDRQTGRSLKTPYRSTAGVKLDQLLEESGRLTYVYILKERWEHEIVLQEVIQDYAWGYPICTAGEMACPLEGLGGAVEYMDFLKAWHDMLDECHSSARAWGNRRGYTGEFNRIQANQFLQQKLPLGQDKLDKYAFELTRSIFETTMSAAFKSQVHSEAVSKTPVVCSFLDLLTELKEHGPLQASSRDQLPTSVVMELRCSGYDCLSPSLDRNDQNNDLLLGEPYSLAKVGGFVKDAHDQITLTNKGLQMLECSPAEVYFALLVSFIRGYQDSFEREPRILEPVLLGHLLKFLHQYGAEQRHVEYYTDLLLEVDPYLIHEYPEDWGLDCIRRHLSHKIFWQILRQVLDQFGLTSSWRKNGSAGEVMLVKKCDLLDEILEFW